jgi:fumarylacetoacetase
LNHAFNAGCLFRTPATALQPNYKHLPVGYHGRASSIVVSGTPVRRPNGQTLLNPTAEPKQPTFSPSRKLDIELELGCFVCTPNEHGKPIPIDQAEEHLFGVVLLNDWSARDIQAWEYVPLGPFLAKSFASTISAWVVLMDALEPFKAAGLESEVEVLPYLQEKDRKSRLNIDLSWSLTPKGGQEKTLLGKTSATQLLFSFPQMLAHHTIGGCPMKTGDLLGSGTISGKENDSLGSLMEMTEGGKKEVVLNGGEKRSFLEDGDAAVLSGVCVGEEGSYVGFGECVGRIEPAWELKF